MTPLFEGRGGILMLPVVGATGPNVPVVTCSPAAAGRGGFPRRKQARKGVEKRHKFRGDLSPM